jgi:hypothetical protein
MSDFTSQVLGKRLCCAMKEFFEASTEVALDGRPNAVLLAISILTELCAAGMNQELRDELRLLIDQSLSTMKNEVFEDPHDYCDFVTGRLND